MPPPCRSWMARRADCNRGYPVEALVNDRFAAVVHLIVFGELPSQQRLAEVAR